MSEHRATIAWKRETESFAYDAYVRDHLWSFDGGARVEASAAPAYRGNPARVDPEEALVAAISSCHMLTFLALCARKRIVVDAYEDEAVGHMEKNEEGRLAITRVTLRPRIAFAAAPPDGAAMHELHEHAHRDCFIANSVRTVVTVEGV